MRPAKEQDPFGSNDEISQEIISNSKSSRPILDFTVYAQPASVTGGHFHTCTADIHQCQTF